MEVVGKSLPKGSPDATLVATALDLGAIVVTTDSHFRHLKQSATGYRGRIERADRIFFTCEHPQALSRIRELIEDIEREYRMAKAKGRRFLIKITEDSFTVYR